MSDRQQIVDVVLSRIHEVLPRVDVQPSDEGRDLRDFAEFDSLSFLELLVWLEGKFSVSIPDEELVVENFSSVTKMVDYILANR